MGTTYLEMDSLNPALAALQKAVEIDPAYINAYLSIGQAYLEKGDTTQAKSFFEQLAAQKADDCQIQVAYGYVMANQLGEVGEGAAGVREGDTALPRTTPRRISTWPTLCRRTGARRRSRISGSTWS